MNYEGLNFKLDVGLYRLDQQVACQRIGKTFTDANLKDRAVAYFSEKVNNLAAAFMPLAPARV